MKTVLVGGARPNFMKIHALSQAINRYNAGIDRRLAIESLMVHTGQHYDYQMSRVFFEDLGLPEPDIYLNVGSGTHAEQTGRVMIEFEKVLFERRPDLVMVVGDVNSTLAAALAAAKLGIPVAHVEAGLRSFDKSMPEEINRRLTDAISDYLFTPSPDANENLAKEGIPPERVFLVGNVMIDTLLHSQKRAEASDILSRLSLKGAYALITLHRPSNVDERAKLLNIAQTIERISQRIPVVFPAHPRTLKNIQTFQLTPFFEKGRISLIEPLGYLDFLKLMMNATFVMTDSGGIQEETTALNIPCITMRDTTERPITVTRGTNILVGENIDRAVSEVSKILDGNGKRGLCPELWDGKAADRIINVITAA